MRVTTDFGFCPSCESDAKLDHVTEVRLIPYKGELIPVHLDYYVCSDCGCDFEVPRPDYDPLTELYREYEKLKKGKV